MPATGIFELAAITGGTGRVQSDDVLALVDVHDATQAAQGSLIKITVAQLYRTETTPVTVSTPLPDIAQAWNAAGVTFTAVKLNVTDTASAAASLLLDLQVGGVSKFSVRKDGTVTVGIVVAAAGTLTGATLASNVLASSLTSVGTLTALTVTPGATAVQALTATLITVTTAAAAAAAQSWTDATNYTLAIGYAGGLAHLWGTSGTTQVILGANAVEMLRLDQLNARLTAAFPLWFTPAVSKIVPGATSISLRNNADTLDNLIITDAGAATFRNTVSGITTLSCTTVTATNLGGTLSTAAQPNVTSIGTVASLTISTIVLGSVTSSTVGAAGAASALPATPAGYWVISISSTNYKIPYYTF